MKESPKGRTILLAEDDPFISRMYQTKLQSSGFGVLMAANGREAAELVSSDHPDLLMLDLDMPEMTGWQALEKLRTDGFDFSTMPVIILTNSSKPEDRDRAKEYAADYLVKSDITPRQVLDIINEKLGINAAEK